MSLEHSTLGFALRSPWASITAYPYPNFPMAVGVLVKKATQEKSSQPFLNETLSIKRKWEQ